MSSNYQIAMFPTERFTKMLEAARGFDAQRLDGQPKLTSVPTLDDATSVFFARQLEYIRPGVMEVQYPELKGYKLVPVDTNVDPGATSYTYQVFDHVGTALVTATMARGPRADVNGKETNQPIRSVVNCYGYSIQEARAAMLARTPLIPRRAMAARDIIERTLDGIVFTGNLVMGLQGLLNQSSVSILSAPLGAQGATNWETKNPDEIVADMNNTVNAIVTASLEIEQPDTILLPLSSYTLISSRRMGDADPNTILSHFLRNSPYVKSVECTHKSEAAGTTGGLGSSKRMVAYRRDPNKLVFILSQPFEQLPPQAEGFELITDCHARTGGVIVFLPGSIRYLDGI